MAQDLGPKLAKQPLSADTPWVDPVEDDSDFNKQMRQVAKLIQISKNEEFVEVTILYVASLHIHHFNVTVVIHLSTRALAAIRLRDCSSPVRHAQRLSRTRQ